MTIIINNNTTTSVLFLFVATLSIMITFVVFPAIPEQGEIIVQSPGDAQRQQYYVKIRP